MLRWRYTLGTRTVAASLSDRIRPYTIYSRESNFTGAICHGCAVQNFNPLPTEFHMQMTLKLCNLTGSFSLPLLYNSLLFGMTSALLFLCLLQGRKEVL